MSKIIEFLAPFKWSEHGFDVTEYAVGDIRTVSDECADTAEADGKGEVLTEADLAKARGAYAKLKRAAVKAQAAADEAHAAAAALQTKADAAKLLAATSRIGRQALADAAQLPDDEPAEGAAPDALVGAGELEATEPAASETAPAETSEA